MKIADKIIPWKIDSAKWFNNRIEFSIVLFYTVLISTYIHANIFLNILYEYIETKWSSIVKQWYIYLVRNRISTWRNKIVIYRYCVIMSNAFARYLPVYFQLTRCTYLWEFWCTCVCVSLTMIHVETTAVIRVIVYGFNNGLMGNRLHCRIRQITSITNTTVAQLVFTTRRCGARISLC